MGGFAGSPRTVKNAGRLPFAALRINLRYGIRGWLRELLEHCAGWGPRGNALECGAAIFVDNLRLLYRLPLRFVAPEVLFQEFHQEKK